MYIDADNFKIVVASTPLVSIDFIVSNCDEQILLGFRKNKPALGEWFVPGGRIRKNETFEEAFLRLTKSELGMAIPIYKSNFFGIYQHFYSDNYSGDDFSTHYIVLAHQLVLDLDVTNLPKEQHQLYQWWDVDDLIRSEQVHRNTKAYFSDNYK